MNQTALEKSILRTLVYFDIFSVPLCSDELYRFLWRPPAISQDDFLVNLKMLVDGGRIGKRDGFYFLPGRQQVVDEVLIRKEICAKKMKIVKRAARVLSWVPFLNAVFLCNSVASGIATEKSDIDFLIVSAPGRLWLVRTLSNFLLRLLCLRTFGDKKSDRVCLSFFVDEKNLDLSSLRAVDEDIHFACWLHQTIPVFDPYFLWRNFINKNQWTVRYMPYRNNDSKIEPMIVWGKFAKWWRGIWEKFWQGWYGDLLEQQAEGLGRQKLKLSIKEKALLGDNGIVLNRGVVKLHEDDARIKIKNQWLEKTRQYGDI